MREKLNDAVLLGAAAGLMGYYVVATLLIPRSIRDKLSKAQAERRRLSITATAK